MATTKPDQIGIGARVQAARAKAGLSQSQLARRAGISQQSVAAIETGRAKRSRHTILLAGALDVTPEWLEGVTPSSVPAPTQTVPVIGSVSVGIWREMRLQAVDSDGSGPVDLAVPYVKALGYEGMRQYATLIADRSVDKVLLEGDFAIWVPHDGAFAHPGKLALIEREKGGAFEYTIRRARRGSSPSELLFSSESTDSRLQGELSAEVRVVGIVVGKYRPL